MSQLSLSLPIVGQPNASEDPKIVTAFSQIVTDYNGNVDATNLTAALAQQLGISRSTTISRAFAQVLSSESRSSNVLGDLTTAGPSVTVTVPANGLVHVFAWADLTAGTAGTNAIVDLLEDSTDLGVVLQGASGPTTWYSARGTTGVSTRLAAGMLTFPAATGTHTYKLQYRSDTNGTSVTFANRKLIVITASAS